MKELFDWLVKTLALAIVIFTITVVVSSLIQAISPALEQVRNETPTSP